MKVAILSDFPLHVIPEFGEAYRPNGHYATWLPQLSAAFAKFSDLEAHWIVLNDQVDGLREVRWQNQVFHVIPTSKKGRASSLFAEDRKAIKALIAAIRPSLVHGWGTEDVYALAAVTCGLPNIVSMQGILTHYILKNRMPARNYLQALIELFVFLKADRITVESEWGREVVLRRNPMARVTLVEYGVQDHFLDVAWKPDPAKPAALFIGSVVARKGIQDAVEAFRSPLLSKAELWVVGDVRGPWAESLRATAPPNVKWIGRKTSPETAEIISRAWCFVLPTRADTSPNVVKEARVIGLPVVSTPCGGQTSYIQHGRNGFLVNPGDIPSLTQNLSKLLGNLEECRALGAHLQEEHRQFLHPLETARKFYEAYALVMRA